MNDSDPIQEIIDSFPQRTSLLPELCQVVLSYWLPLPALAFGFGVDWTGEFVNSVSPCVPLPMPSPMAIPFQIYLLDSDLLLHSYVLRDPATRLSLYRWTGKGDTWMAPCSVGDHHFQDYVNKGIEAWADSSEPSDSSDSKSSIQFPLTYWKTETDAHNRQITYEQGVAAIVPFRSDRTNKVLLGDFLEACRTHGYTRSETLYICHHIGKLLFWHAEAPCRLGHAAPSNPLYVWIDQPQDVIDANDANVNAHFDPMESCISLQLLGIMRQMYGTLDDLSSSDLYLSYQEYQYKGKLSRSDSDQLMILTYVSMQSAYQSCRDDHDDLKREDLVRPLCVWPVWDAKGSAKGRPDMPSSSSSTLVRVLDKLKQYMSASSTTTGMTFAAFGHMFASQYRLGAPDLFRFFNWCRLQPCLGNEPASFREAREAFIKQRDACKHDTRHKEQQSVYSNDEKSASL